MGESHAEIGIVGGTGLYDMEALESVADVVIDTPFGRPSAPIRLGTLAGCRVAFLARHEIGRAHV